MNFVKNVFSKFRSGLLLSIVGFVGIMISMVNIGTGENPYIWIALIASWILAGTGIFIVATPTNKAG